MQLRTGCLGPFQGHELPLLSVQLALHAIDLTQVMLDFLLLLVGNGEQLVPFGYGVLVDGLVLLEHLFKVGELGFCSGELFVNLSNGSCVGLAGCLLARYLLDLHF